MRMIFGQIVVCLIVVGGYFLSIGDVSYSNGINPDMLFWTTGLLALGLLTFKLPKIAFPIILVLYLFTVIYRYLMLGGELVLFIFVHFIFISSMIIAVSGAYARKK